MNQTPSPTPEELCQLYKKVEQDILFLNSMLMSASQTYFIETLELKHPDHEWNLLARQNLFIYYSKLSCIVEETTKAYNSEVSPLAVQLSLEKIKYMNDVKKKK